MHSSLTERVVLPLDDWVAVLALARRWGFEDISALALSRMETFNIEEVYKVELAHRFELKHWYFDAYMKLAKREKSLTTEEALRLGIDFSLKIVKAREVRIRTTYV